MGSVSNYWRRRRVGFVRATMRVAAVLFILVLLWLILAPGAAARLAYSQMAVLGLEPRGVTVQYLDWSSFTSGPITLLDGRLHASRVSAQYRLADAFRGKVRSLSIDRAIWRMDLIDGKLTTGLETRKTPTDPGPWPVDQLRISNSVILLNLEGHYLHIPVDIAVLTAGSELIVELVTELAGQQMVIDGNLDLDAVQGEFALRPGAGRLTQARHNSSIDQPVPWLTARLGDKTDDAGDAVTDLKIDGTALSHEWLEKHLGLDEAKLIINAKWNRQGELNVVSGGLTAGRWKLGDRTHLKPSLRLRWIEQRLTLDVSMGEAGNTFAATAAYAMPSPAEPNGHARNMGRINLKIEGAADHLTLARGHIRNLEGSLDATLALSGDRLRLDWNEGTWLQWSSAELQTTDPDAEVSADKLRIEPASLKMTSGSVTTKWSDLLAGRAEFQSTIIVSGEPSLKVLLGDQSQWSFGDSTANLRVSMDGADLRVIHADLTTTQVALEGSDGDVASAQYVRIELYNDRVGTIHAHELFFADSMWPDVVTATLPTDGGWELLGQWELERGMAIDLAGRLDNHWRNGAPSGLVRAELPVTRLNRNSGDAAAQGATGATTVERFAQLKGWDFFGAVGAWAQVDFGPQGTTHRGEVNFERLHGELSSQQPDEGHRARFFGLSGKMTLSSLFPLQTQGTQRLALRALMLELPGFPRMEQFADLEAHYRLGGEDGVFIEQAHASWVEYRWRGRGRYGRSDPIIDRLYREGNRISAYALQIEPNASGFDTTLHLQNFNLFALLEGITDGKVRGGGRLTGRITLGFEGGNWRWPQAMLVAEPQDRLTPEPVTSGEDAHQLRYQGSYRVSDPQLKFIILDSARSAIRTHPNRSIIMGILDNALDQFNYTSLEVRSFGSGDSGRLIFTGYGRTRDDDIGMQDHRIDLRLSADVVRRILRLGDTD